MVGEEEIGMGRQRHTDLSEPRSVARRVGIILYLGRKRGQCHPPWDQGALLAHVIASPPKTNSQLQPNHARDVCIAITRWAWVEGRERCHLATALAILLPQFPADSARLALGIASQPPESEYPMKLGPASECRKLKR